jgi:oligoribonuclease
MASPLVWIDLEMTGLDPETCSILEIAVVLTDDQLEILPGHYEAAIHHPRESIRMGPAVAEMHARSGLIERVVASKTSLAQAEEGALAFLSARCAPAESPLCGNSVHVDRRFIRRYMPRLDGFLHYRHIDVTTVKELARRWYPAIPAFPKTEQHTALSDIRESIGELRHYRQAIFKS